MSGVVLQPRLKNSKTLAKLGSMFGQVDADKRSQLVDLIQTYPGIFSDTPTCTNLMEHDVDVGGVKPITQRFYRVSPEKRKILDSEVDYMLENGLAVPCTSSWSSPCLLVSKPDYTFRPCTDFRKINAVTKPDSFPLPRVDDCVDQVATVAYLGKVVGRGEVRTIQEKIRAIRYFPVLTTKKELLRFLEMAGYYREFCPNYASVGAPLTDLL